MDCWNWWFFLRHFEKEDYRPLKQWRLPLSLLARYPRLIKPQLLVNNFFDKRVRLNRAGRAQAQLFAARFAAFLAEQNIRLDTIVVSPYRRTQESAQVVLSHLPRVQIEPDWRLAEFQLGIRTGRTYEELCVAFPEYAAAVARRGFLDVAAPGGKSHREQCAKLLPWIQELKRANQNVLVVTHAGMVECANHLLCQPGDNSVLDRLASGRATPPGSLFICRYRQSTGQIECLAHDLLLAP